MLRALLGGPSVLYHQQPLIHNMPKKIGKSNQRQTEQRAVAAQRRTLRRSNALSNSVQSRLKQQAVHATCGLTDPFCPYARSAKYPDDSPVRTLPYTQKGRINLGSDVNGELRYLWYPQYGFVPVTYSAAATGAAVTAWTDFANDSSISGVAKYRIVSAGYRLKSIIAPLNASGEVNLRDWPDTAANLAAVDCLSYNATSSMSIATRLVDETTGVSSHTFDLPQLFYPASGASAIVTSTAANGFNPQTIYATGLPVSTVCFVLEYVIHYELIFLDSSSMSLLTTPSPPANSMLTAAAARVSSALPSFFDRGAKALGDLVIRKATLALGSALGGPAGGAAANGILALTVD
jgi:hypothetical protein